MSIPRAVRWHLYQNFLMPERLDEYRALLRQIVDKDYRFKTVEAFATEVKAGRPGGGRSCVLRVDVDSDPKGAARMFDAAYEQGVQATYYFRLSTLDRPLAQRIAASGSEVGYHFEELSTYSKRQGLKTAAEIDDHIGAIRDDFRRNVAVFREALGVWPRTIAAHGDFLNRRLGVKNNRLVDRTLMEECGILAETHESWLMTAVSARVSDRPAPQWWHPRSPLDALAGLPEVLYVLVHPRQWVRAPLLNTSLDLRRGGEEIAYRWRRMRRGTRS